ncbi:Adenylyl cyclase class-3/4/guanylyl cyclase [Trinorchestia longiramus]|nr:Adenylyl cyclase class-3/4/guanylyl cyclase [Trinorchestia longiramus]
MDVSLATKIDTGPKKLSSSHGSQRPDLLQGSFGSPRAGLRTPRSSNAKNVPQNSHNKLCPTSSHGSIRDSDEIKAKYNMHDLRHENINAFLGMMCDPIRPGFVFDYASRGSLEDVIRKKDIKLDWFFKLSLLTDLVRGMRYLHGSPLRQHGRLTSRNCVIDARWVLKVTDYVLNTVYEAQNIPHPKRSTKDLLWKAPELLRNDSLLIKGTPHGDVYSFGIIMQEVLLRGEPYCMLQLSHQEILSRLRDPPPMIRPSVRQNVAPPDAINVMKQCWAEIPEMRPDFNEIHETFKKLNMGRRQNIVDTMFQMLEKYSSNLEDLIKERTEQLDVEKKKTEQLLNRMLPSSVADQLKLGMQVAPEEFDEVTIYFSDIVGFTTISAYSTPFEVVDLLNDLYTAFDATIDHYNVYKVETIGDAYMVVGGVPMPIEDHAQQTAQMALDLLHLSGKFKIRHLHNISLMLRIGMHTGPCCAGVVGMTMPRYCLFGDTVNTASRMESTGAAWRIHISEQTAFKLRESGDYHLEYRGRTQIKGKGLLPTYWLLGKDDFKKELPKAPDIGLDEELIKQGRQHYATRRDSVVEAMSAAKFLSQAAAQSGVSGISLSRGNSFNRPQSRCSARNQELPTISDTESPLERCKNTKLSPLQQSPESDSPEIERTIVLKKNMLQVPGAKMSDTSSGSPKGTEIQKRIIPKCVKTERALLSNSTSKVSSTSDTSRECLKKSTASQGTSTQIGQASSVRQKSAPSPSSCRAKVPIEPIVIMSNPSDLKPKDNIPSKEFKVRTKHQSTNISQEPLTIRHHKTSSSSDMSRKSNDRKSGSGAVKVCKPGSGCRGRMAQSILPHPVPAYDRMLACAPALYGDPYAAAILPQSHPYHISHYVKTLPKSKERTNVHSLISGQSLRGTYLSSYNTIPRPSRYSAHLSQVIAHPVYAAPVFAPPTKPCTTQPCTSALKKMTHESQTSVDKHLKHKTLDANSKSKSRSNPNFPPDIRTLTESTML